MGLGRDMSRKITEQEVREWLKKNRPNIELIEYGGLVRAESRFCCNICGYTWEVPFSSIKDKRNTSIGCPKCAKRSGAKKQSVTERQAREWLKEHRPDIELVKYSGASHTKSKFRCKKDGYEWVTSFSSVKRGSGCSKCAGTVRIKEEEVKEWLENNRPDIELIEYGGGSSKLSRFHCVRCDRVWLTTFDNIKRGTGCPDCICKYKKDGVTYDSRGEFVWFLYQELRGRVWYRNEQERNKGYYVLYRDKNNKERQFHPDYYIIDSCFKKMRCYKDGAVCYVRIKMVEIKPDDGGWDKHHEIKRKIAEKYGIDFVGNTEIGTAERILHDKGITGSVIEQYRLNKEELEKCARDWLNENRPEIELIEFSGYSWSAKSKFRCKRCGYMWTAVYGSVKSGRGCPNCVGKARVTENAVRKWLSKNRPDIELLKYGGGVHKESQFRCLVCGNVWDAKFDNIKYGKGCPKCANKSRAEKRRVTENEVREWLKKNRSDIELVKYGGCVRDKSTFRCKVCGNVWCAVFASVKRGSGCPNWRNHKDIEQYRVNDKKDKPKVKKQNKSDGCEELCCFSS